MRRLRWFPVLLVLVAFRWGFAQSPGAVDRPVFTFVVASDPHTAQNRPGEPAGSKTLEMLLAKVAALSERPDFIVITGDIHVTAFKKVLAKTKSTVPLHLIPGNHESRADRQTLAAMFPGDFTGKDFYAFRHKGSLFVCLADAADNGDHVGHFDSQGIRGEGQGAWLKKQLADNAGKADHVFIFAHIPPSATGTVEGGMSLSTNDQTYLRDLVRQYKLTALFFGHLHRRVEFKIADSPVYVLPSTNWNFGTTVREFVQVRVFKARIETTFVPLSGK